METRITIQNNSGDIIWDPDRCLDLGLVLAELIANADEHAFRNQADRTIHIELSRPAPDQLELTISDNGAGFPQEPPPEQAHTLGLPLVRSIVERNFNGSLLLENTPGATITIRLPAA